MFNKNIYIFFCYEKIVKNLCIDLFRFGENCRITLFWEDV